MAGMTRDEIIKLAADCGFTLHGEPMLGVEHLVRLAYERGVAAERERLGAFVAEMQGRATLYDPRGSLGEPIV